MDRRNPAAHAPTLASALAFLAIAVAIWIALVAGAERLACRNGHTNPLFKVESAGPAYDWVILGASHAMPLDFDDFNGEMQRETGLRILNLAGPGVGPLYNRFVLEHFLAGRTTRNVLYVVDAFAFRSPAWNEDRFSDPGLLARTPLDAALATRLAAYVRDERVDVRALLAYATGFALLNDRTRFAVDRWEGEAQFDRVFRPSASAERKRVDYLYPPVGDEAALRDRYLSTLGRLVKLARAKGATVTLAKFPLPPRFRALLPGEAEFDAAIAGFAAAHAVPFRDFTAAIGDGAFYADTDHLNRAGVRKLFQGNLRQLLMPPAAP